MCENKFYICEHCGNIIGLIRDAGVPMMCCGQKMTKLVPGTVEASKEKHIPVISVEEGCVKVSVGSVEHPMTGEHYIQWIYLQTDRGGQRKCLALEDKPEVTFAIKDETPVAVYAYCNQHGLWMADVEPQQVCDLQPLDTKSNNDYIICKCNKVSYFDILDAIKSNNNIDNLLDVFNSVKNTTHCSTGCGGCYDKVIAVISAAMANETK